jgi:hypothetical protein
MGMKIKEFDWATVPDQAVMIYIGRRKSGKTTNIIDTFYKKRNSFKAGLIFCGSKATIKEYERHFPSSFIYYGYHSDVLGALIDKQEMDVEMGVAAPMFILVDDCMWAKKSILADPNIRRVFMNGRHSLIFFVLSMQYCMDLHPSLRQQIDYTFLSREKNPQNRERLYKNYNVCFTSYEQFDECMKKCTLNHETMILNNEATDSDLPEDNVFWWKAKYVKDGRKFRVNKYGSWWQFHKKRYNPRHYIKDAQIQTKHNIGAGVIVTKVRSSNKRKRTRSSTNHNNKWHNHNGQHARGEIVTRKKYVNQSTKAAEWMNQQRQQNMGPRKKSFTSGVRNVETDIRIVSK